MAGAWVVTDPVQVWWLHNNPLKGYSLHLLREEADKNCSWCVWGVVAHEGASIPHPALTGSLTALPG